MNKSKPCPFNLPLKAVDPIDVGSGKSAYPVLIADCEGEFVSGVVGHVRFETGPYSGTGIYMSYDLAKDMAEYACNAINQFADINKIKADAVAEFIERSKDPDETSQVMYDWLKREYEKYTNKIERGEV